MACTKYMAALVLCAFSVGANAALISRADGLAYYEDVLNITLLTDANYAKTNTFGVADISIYGTMTWVTANTWLTAMNDAQYLGLSAWRLPTVHPINGVAYDPLFTYNGLTDSGYNITAPGTAYAGSTAHELGFYPRCPRFSPDSVGTLGRLQIRKTPQRCGVWRLSRKLSEV